MPGVFGSRVITGGQPSPPQSTLGTLLEQLQKQQESAQTANLARYQEALAIYDEIINRYRPGGTFGQAALAQLEKRKIRDVGEETQQLISSGLYGTTTMGGTGRRWEEAVGAPERLKLEDIQMQRLSEAQTGKAEFVERREDVGPSSELVAQLASQAGQAGYGQTGITTTYGKTFGAPSFPDMFSIAGKGGYRAPTTAPSDVTGGYSPAAIAQQEQKAAAVTPTAGPTGETATVSFTASDVERREFEAYWKMTPAQKAKRRRSAGSSQTMGWALSALDRYLLGMAPASVTGEATTKTAPTYKGSYGTWSGMKA